MCRLNDTTIWSFDADINAPLPGTAFAVQQVEVLSSWVDHDGIANPSS
jgi:hypothetical protein